MALGRRPALALEEEEREELCLPPRPAWGCSCNACTMSRVGPEPLHGMPNMSTGELAAPHTPSNAWLLLCSPSISIFTVKHGAPVCSALLE